MLSIAQALPPRALWPRRIPDRVQDQVSLAGDVRRSGTANLSQALVDRHVCDGRADAVAVIAGRRYVTYRSLQAHVNRLSNHLVAAGVAPGDRVVLRLRNDDRSVAAWLAVQRVGAVAVVTPTAARARELAHILNDVEPRACLTDASLAPDLERAMPGLIERPILIDIDAPIAIEGADVPARDGVASGAAPGLGDLAAISYTSGTEVDPKGACYFVSDLLAVADAYAGQVLRLSSSDIIGGPLSLSFAFGLGAMLVFPLSAGACSVLLDGFNADTLLHVIASHRITVLCATATTYRMLLRLPDLESRADFRSLRLAVSSGERLEAETALEWRHRTSVELIDSFGTTEMCHVFLSQRPGAIEPGSLGTPVPGYEVRVVDNDLRDVAAGTPGALAVRGPTGCVYWRRQGAQSRYVRDGWNLTGDVVTRDADGRFWFRGRRDDLIISAGYKVSRAEVERVLRAHPGVEDASVLTEPDPVRGAVPAALIVCRPGTGDRDALARTIQQYLLNELSPYKCPRRLQIVDRIPSLATGGPVPA
jgi:2-aminobenzoate-CoA ligase